MVDTQKPDIAVINITGQQHAAQLLKNIRSQYEHLLLIVIMDNAQFVSMLRNCYDMGIYDCVPEQYIETMLKSIIGRAINSVKYKNVHTMLRKYTLALEKSVYAIDYPYIVSVDGHLFKSRLAHEFDKESCIKKEGFFVIKDEEWTKEIKNGDKISVIISQGASEDFNAVKEVSEERIAILKFIKIKKQEVRATEDGEIYGALKSLKECSFSIVYKGLVIHGKFSIVTKDEASHTVFAKIPMQYLTAIRTISKDGAVVEVEGKHARCDVLLKDNMVALKNFSYTSSAFKKRENLRVEPSRKIVVSVAMDDITFEGAIIDISLRSIAIYTETNLKKITLNQGTTVSFTLAGEKFAAEGLLFKIERIGEDSHYMKKIPNCFEANKYFAAIINYSLQPKESEIVNKYISFRQSEIITEIKNK